MSKVAIEFIPNELLLPSSEHLTCDLEMTTEVSKEVA